MIIKNNLIPFKGFSAMAVFPFIFVRKDWLKKLEAGNGPNMYNVKYEAVLNHEKIHLAQQIEVFLIGCVVMLACMILVGYSSWFLPIPFMLFSVLYCVDWILGVVSGEKQPYSKICFEKEAYKHESDHLYLENRKMFSWIKYI